MNLSDLLIRTDSPVQRDRTVLWLDSLDKRGSDMLLYSLLAELCDYTGSRGHTGRYRLLHQKLSDDISMLGGEVGVLPTLWLVGVCAESLDGMNTAEAVPYVRKLT